MSIFMPFKKISDTGLHESFDGKQVENPPCLTFERRARGVLAAFALSSQLPIHLDFLLPPQAKVDVVFGVILNVQQHVAKLARIPLRHKADTSYTTVLIRECDYIHSCLEICKGRTNFSAAETQVVHCIVKLPHLHAPAAGNVLHAAGLLPIESGRLAHDLPFPLGEHR